MDKRKSENYIPTHTSYVRGIKIDFQDGGYGRHLGFQIRTILVIFDLQVTLMLPTKF